MEEKVKNVIESIRPFLIQDGGNIEFIKIENDTVYVKMMGACAHCAMMLNTLEDGVLAAIQEEVPEIKNIKNMVS